MTDTMNSIPTLAEQRSRQQQRAKAAERALSEEKAKAERLAARLRELGIDPNDP
jgi:hypothetical protein